MQNLAKALQNEQDFSEIFRRIDAGGCPVVVSGLSGVHRAHVAAALRLFTGRPVFILCPDELEVEKLAGDVAALTGEDALTLGSRDFTFYNAEGVSRQLEQGRIRTLYAMGTGQAPIVVAGAAGMIQRTMPRARLLQSGLSLRLGESCDIHEVAERLSHCGYTRGEQVEGPGQFALRGGILDFFSPALEEPVRCEFFGDEIDSMSFFDTDTQRRTDTVEEALILPAAEALVSLYEDEGGAGAEALCVRLTALMESLKRKKGTKVETVQGIQLDIQRLRAGLTLPAADKYMALLYPMATATDYIPEDAVVLVSDPGKVGERIKGFEWQLGEDIAAMLETGRVVADLMNHSISAETLYRALEEFPVVMADSFTAGSYPLNPRGLYNITAKQLPTYGGSLDTAATDIEHYLRTAFRTVILCQDARRAGNLRDFLAARGISATMDFGLEALPAPGRCLITLGSLSAGMEYPAAKLAVITEGQLFTPKMQRRRKKKAPSNREKVQNFADLSPGDLVVHEYHGIGRYVGMFKIPVDGVEKDYIKISYAGTDSLYVPATQLDLISKYIGGGEDAPVRLSKMGGAEWARVKTRAKAAAKEMAKELIALYAERQRQRGHAFAPDSVWQTEFEERFGYAETGDQLRCIEEVKADMEREMPMDRLLCGDVGYGKTEVALRAVMKCVLDGYQAAILVPTTVLAQQHFVTAVNRFAGYPIEIEVLSRFRTPAQIRKALAKAAAGQVDILIGTHRILQKDVKFKKLGLLIVDEEQRFGVVHKERLKEMARQVDVLTLSATPIPRTLNMALSGIRDMSTLEEPPLDRQPVQTYVMEHDYGVLCDAIRREVARGGQVYYLHNLVENIERTAARLSGMLEGITVATAHGKMDEETLSDVMERMAQGEIQVLVCTTIIETGIDIPNVNTLIVEDADKLGLSQLHQIRGRVGRSPRRAYAYLTYRAGKVLTEVAEKRLSAIREFAEFNSGFKIAMRDLEIRGAGDLLGAEQSGHMVSVGYDMYLKLLEEAVLEERGEKPAKPAECAADLSVSAYIPEKYVPSAEHRMDLYRRIARIRTEDDADDMISELIDRFGDPPSATLALVTIALMRGEAAAAGISDIAQKGGWLRLTFTDFDFDRVSRLYERPEYKGRVKIEAGNIPVIALKLKSGKAPDEALRLIRAYAAEKA